MFVARSLRTNEMHELNTIEELIQDLEVLNIKNKKLEKSETISIYETDSNGEIIDEFEVDLPTNKSIEDVLISDEDYSEETQIRDVNYNDMTDEEKEVFNRINKTEIKKEVFKENTREESIKDSEKKQREIIEKIQRKKVEEDNNYVSNYKEKPRNNYEYQTPVRPQKIREIQSNQVTTVYEGMTLVPADELKNDFKYNVSIELEKIERHIFLLERQAKEYRRLMNAIDSLDY